MVKTSKSSRCQAFTLIELLIVIAMMAMLMMLAMVGLRGVGGANNFGAALNLIGGTLEQARAYAMANGTYVFVGLAETEALQSSSANPVVAPGTGEVWLAAVASKDGTAGYDPLSGNIAWANYANGANLAPLGRLRVISNLHFQIANPLPASGNTVRPAATVVLANQSAATPFAWPLGAALNNGKIQFNTVIQFSPSGSANFIPQGATGTSPPAIIEIGLQPSHGNIAPPTPGTASASDFAAIQLVGVTGSVKIYRP